MMVRVANIGGEIRHSEIRGSNILVQPDKKHEEDDD
jgi:hypothetical protein